MSDSQQIPEESVEKFQSDLNRLKQLIRVMHAVSDIRYNYHYLCGLEPQATHEFIMHVEAVTTGLVVSYGRLFSTTTKVTQLDAKLVPQNLRHIHDAIMKLRHERYAHHGSHDSIQTDLDIHFDGTSFILNPRLNILVCMGAPKEWAPLFKWLDQLIFDKLQKQLDHLSKISGVEWKVPFGSPPYWIP